MMKTCEGSTPLLLTRLTLRSARASGEKAAPQSANATNMRVLFIGIGELVFGSVLRLLASILRCSMQTMRAAVGRYDIHPRICAIIRGRHLQRLSPLAAPRSLQGQADRTTASSGGLLNCDRG